VLPEVIAQRQATAGALVRELFSKVSPELQKPPEELPAPPQISDIEQLPDAINEFRKHGRVHEVRRQISILTYTALEKIGSFYCATGPRGYFLDKRLGFLHPLDSERFANLLATLTGLNPTEIEFKFVLEHLKVTAANLPEQPIRVLSHFDIKEGLFYLHGGGKEVHLADASGPLKRVDNGDGQLFLTQADSEPLTPDYSANGKALEWFLDLPSFSEDEGGLTRQELKLLLLTVVIFLLISQEERPILVPIGPRGSGKTTAMRALLMLFLGSQPKPTSISVDRPLDDIVILLANNSVAVVDNMDSFVRGVENLLATFVTNATYKRRKLFTDGEQYEIRLGAKILGITCRTPRFTRPDVAQRIIPLPFEKPRDGVIGETALYSQILEKRPLIMGDLLMVVSRVIGKLSINAPRLNVRLADFAEFGWRMHARQEVDGRWVSFEWVSILGKLTAAQDRFIASDNGLIEAIDVLLNDGVAIVDMPSAELFQKCRAVAEVRRLILPKSSISFGQVLTESASALESELKVKFVDRRGRAGRRFITITPIEARARRKY